MRHYCFFLVSLILSTANSLESIYPPSPEQLKKVSSIDEAEGVEFVAHFPEYKDAESYGQRPQCLDDAHLLTLNSIINWNDPKSYQIKSKKDVYIARMNDTFVAPSLFGTIFDYKQQLLFSVTVKPNATIFPAVNSTIKSCKVIRCNKLATVQGPSYYYHCVIDRLPSILLLRNLLASDFALKIIINAHNGIVPQYYLEYLDLLGIPREQIIVAQKNTLYFADMLYFATPFLMEPIPRKLLLELREALLLAANQRKPSRRYKDNLIVVIQRRENNRQIQNIRELLNLLISLCREKHEIVIFDASMSVSEQIQIFNKARLIIGVMASGLTNVIYAQPGTTVIEIHPQLSCIQLDNNNNNTQGYEWCWWLSSVVGLDYRFVVAPFDFNSSTVVCPISEIAKILRNIKI